MKLSGKILFPILTAAACLLCFPAIAQEENAAPQDSTGKKNSLKIASLDSSATLADSAWLSTVKGKAMARLSTWDNEEISAQSVEMTVEQHTPQLLLEQIARSIATSNPEDTPGYDFRNNTAYRMDAAHEFVTPEHLKRNDILWVSGPEAVMEASKFLQKEPDEPDISLTENEINILKTLWERPNVSAKAWYKKHYEQAPGRPMAYLAFLQEVNRLHAKDLINIETKEEVQYFSPTISRSLLVWMAKQELISSDAIFNAARHYELLKMQESLEKREDDEPQQ